MNDDLHLTHKQYLDTLIRFRKAIAGGLELEYFDCEDIGAKDTQCTFGLCSHLKARWPDPETHMWPDDKRDEGSEYIYGIKYLRKNQLCPLDKRNECNGGSGDTGDGCFYHCKIFQSNKKNHPTRDEVVKLYDLCIDKLINNPKGM